MKYRHHHYKCKQPKTFIPLTEGEPYCPGCFKHADSCQCLESFFCDDPRCFGNASEGTEE